MIVHQCVPLTRSTNAYMLRSVDGNDNDNNYKTDCFTPCTILQGNKLYGVRPSEPYSFTCDVRMLH